MFLRWVCTFFHFDWEFMSSGSWLWLAHADRKLWSAVIDVWTWNQDNKLFWGYGGASLPQDEAHRWKMTQVSDDKWVLLGNWGFAFSDHEQVSELLWDFGASSEEIDNTACLPQGHGDDGHCDNMWRPTLSRDTADPHKRSFLTLPWWQNDGNCHSVPISTHECTQAWEGVLFLRMTASCIINSRWSG